MASTKLIVQNMIVSIMRIDQSDYISLTDIARVKNPDEPKDVVKNWLRSRSTIEFLGLWEKINNPNFKGVEFDSFKSKAGANSFTLSPNKWIETTSAIGIRSSSGRGGGTYAHKDIAFEFASWISLFSTGGVFGEISKLSLGGLLQNQCPPGISKIANNVPRGSRTTHRHRHLQPHPTFTGSLPALAAERRRNSGTVAELGRGIRWLG